METAPQTEPLNAREIQILALIADGLSNREIAQKLHLSLETVKWYNKQLFAKLGVESRAQAASLAKKNQLIPAAQEGSPVEAATPLSQLVRGRMVGRQREIDQLREIWVQAKQGHGHLVLISGEPGIGKTRLANELITSAIQEGTSVLHGGCYEFEATTPYLPFVEAFREWVHRQPADVIRERMADTASELVRLAPEIESKLGRLPLNPALPPGEERLRLFDYVTRFLQSLAREHNLLFFIDDLHWADQGTLSLLAYILRNLRNDRVLILTAYREVELDRRHPLAAVLVEWNRERLATRIALDRLTIEETSALLANLFDEQIVSDDLTRALYKETEGNPFFIEEEVKALIDQGGIYRKNNQWQRMDVSMLAIPQSLKEAIGRRLDRLSDTCLDVMHTAAAIGKEFDFKEIAAVSQLDEDALLDALDEASAAQLLRSTSSEAFSFTHDKIREVLYEEANPIRRKRLHQHIGETLEAQYQQGNPVSVQDLAHHFMKSGDLARFLNYSVLAAEEASRLFALDDALRYYETAHEAAETLHEDARLAAIHKAIGEIHSQRGQVNLAVKYYQRAIDLETDPEQRAEIQARIGLVYTSAGDARGLPLIEKSLQELNPQTQASLVALSTAMLGRYYHYRAIYSKAIEYFERARSIAEPLDDVATLTEIYAWLAGAYQHLTRFPASMAWARKNIALGQRKNHPLSEAYGYEFLAEDSAFLGEWKAGLEYGERDREIGQRIGAQDRVAWGAMTQAIARYGLGDLAEAERDAQLARMLSENIGDTRLAVFVGGQLVQILADLGKDTQANELGEHVLEETDSLNHVYFQVNTRHRVAYSLLQQRQVGRALDLYLEADELIRPTENLWMPMTYLPWLAQAYVEAGQMDEAARMAARGLELARNAGSRSQEALSYRVQAQVSAASGDWAAAFDLISRSAQILEETETRLELGRTIFTRGKIHQLHGESHAAAEDKTRALEIFSALGAAGPARIASE